MKFQLGFERGEFNLIGNSYPKIVFEMLSQLQKCEFSAT